jgi:hypothetical protein
MSRAFNQPVGVTVGDESVDEHGDFPAAVVESFRNEIREEFLAWRFAPTNTGG